jgi:hypothetical protein
MKQEITPSPTHVIIDKKIIVEVKYLLECFGKILGTLERIEKRISFLPSQISKEIRMTTKEKEEIIDEKIKDEVREQQIAEDFKF